MQLELFSEVYYDIETQFSADEVGGWHNIHLMKVAVAVSWSATDDFKQWDEPSMPEFLDYITCFDKIISFNGDGFDSQVLSYYGNVSILHQLSFDLMIDLRRKLGHRLSLESLAQATLQVGKTADGLQSLRWWKEGRIDLIAAYCRQDVQVLVDLVTFARQHGFVKYIGKTGEVQTVQVRW